MKIGGGHSPKFREKCPSVLGGERGSLKVRETWMIIRGAVDQPWWNCSLGKVTATLFWNNKNVAGSVPIAKGHNKLRYCQILTKLRLAIKKKRLGVKKLCPHNASSSLVKAPQTGDFPSSTLLSRLVTERLLLVYLAKENLRRSVV